MAQTEYICGDCDHRWQGKPPEAREDDPRCSECGGRAVEEVEAAPGPGFDPNRAVGGRSDGGRTEQLAEALRATPGVGDAGTEYACYWHAHGADDAESLHEVLLEVDGVSQPAARRIVESVLGEQGEPDDAAPFALDGPDGGDSDGETFIDQLAKAKRAGLLGNEGGGGTDAEAVATAVTEAISPVLQQMSQTQKMLAESRQDGDSELDDLRQQVEELAEEREREELRELESEIQDLKRGSDPDEDIARLRETREMMKEMPTVSAEAASEWSGVLHSLIDRAESAERQRAILGEPGADSRQPEYVPRPPGQGRPRQQAPAQAPRQRPAPGPQATADGGTAPGGGRPPGGASDDDRDPSGGEPTDSEMAERAAEIRESLGIEGGNS